MKVATLILMLGDGVGTGTGKVLPPTLITSPLLSTHKPPPPPTIIPKHPPHTILLKHLALIVMLVGGEAMGLYILQVDEVEGEKKKGGGFKEKKKTMLVQIKIVATYDYEYLATFLVRKVFSS